MKAVFLKEFGNKKKGFVCEMTSALFAELKREGIVDLYKPEQFKEKGNDITVKVNPSNELKVAKPKKTKK